MPRRHGRGVLTAFKIEVEASLAGLAAELDGEDRHTRLRTLRRWWRDLRAREAERLRVSAWAEPELPCGVELD